MLIVFAIIPFFYNIYLVFMSLFQQKGFTFCWLGKLDKVIHRWGILGLKSISFYTFVCLAIQLVLGMVCFANRPDDPGFGIIRSVLTLTLVISHIAGMIFLIMEDVNYGLIPWALKAVGLIDKKILF